MLHPEDSPPDFVVLDHVTKSFGGMKAVDTVSLAIGKGEFFSLLGASGCGKTTLMRMIAGFEKPDSGRILLDGQDVSALAPHQRPVNMMFQNYALFPHMSVEANIAFGLKQQKLETDQIRQRTAEMMALVQLEGLGARKPDQLSGGQRQRVALARALARGPKLLLLDEPLAALDKKLRKETQSELKRIQKESSSTFIVVTHDQEEAMALSDRIAIMRQGRVEQVGAPARIYDRPANAYVAGFMGEANLMPVTIAARDGKGIHIRVDGIEEPVVLPTSALTSPDGFASSKKATLCIRPERLKLVGKPDRTCEYWLSGAITERIDFGSNMACRFRASTNREWRVLLPAYGSERASGAEATVFLGFCVADARLLVE